MLRFVEETLLLLLGDEDGRFASVPSWSLDYALAGGVLMDLALENRIDTDLENLVLIDSTPTGDNLLDHTLADIAAEERHDTRFWVERIASNAHEIREDALERLVLMGILERHDDRFMWVFRSRRYPIIDGSCGARSETPHHGCPVQRRDTRPARRYDYLPCRRLRHLR